MRLNRFLASAGEGSRRSCEQLIRTAQVTVNGVVCTELATQVEEGDVVKVGNRVLHAAPSRTLLIHKPKGFVCTTSDEQGRRTVFDLLPPNTPRLFHVGRLDKESEGLLLLTNDGDLSLKLTHPRYKSEKEYEVVLDRPFDFDLTPKLIQGFKTPEGWARAESVYRLGANKVKVILTQGIKRQIRLMFYELGYEVERLVRVRIGTLTIEGMPPASWRVLTQKEITALLASGTAPARPRPSAPAKSAATKPRPGGRKPTAASAGKKAGSRTASKPSGSSASDSAPASRKPRAGSRHSHPRLSSRTEDDPSRSRREGSPKRRAPR